MVITYRKVAALVLSILFCFLQKIFTMPSDDAASSDAATSSEVVYNEDFFSNFSAQVIQKLLLECVYAENGCLKIDIFERLCTGTEEGSLFHLYYETLRNIGESDLDKPYLSPGKVAPDEIRSCSFQWQMCNALFMSVAMFMSFPSAYKTLHGGYARCFEAVKNEGIHFLDTTFPLCVLLKNIYEKQGVQELHDKQLLEEKTVRNAAERLYAISEDDVRKFSDATQGFGSAHAGQHGANGFFNGSGGGNVYIQVIVNKHEHRHYHQENNQGDLDDTQQHDDKPSSLRQIALMPGDSSVSEEKHPVVVEEKKRKYRVSRTHVSGWKSLISRLAVTLGTAFFLGFING